jgi:thiamine phosphate synthase YjbQ (UPF0047 family)
MPPPPDEPPRPRALAFSVAGVVLAAFLAAVLAGGATWLLFAPALPPMASAVSVVRPMPNVLTSVRDLARLESTTYHLERVVDLTDKQDLLFGLLQAEDGILLVAAADVTAGIDLAELREADVIVDLAAKRARIRLPPARVLSTRLDSEHTYVHTRTTGILAKRRESLETRARAEAEKSMEEAALQSGILKKAQSQAARTVESLVRSLGYTDVEVSARP